MIYCKVTQIHHLQTHRTLVTVTQNISYPLNNNPSWQIRKKNTMPRSSKLYKEPIGGRRFVKNLHGATSSWYNKTKEILVQNRFKRIHGRVRKLHPLQFEILLGLYALLVFLCGMRDVICAKIVVGKLWWFCLFYKRLTLTQN